jgi:hypothetical protein
LAKKTLKSENNYIYRVLGIVSSAKDYRICHYINKELEFKFCAGDEVFVEQKIGQAGFNMKPYAYQPEESICKYFFINNKNENDLLIPKLKEMDYFLLVEGEILKTEWNHLVKTLKTINVIQHFIEIEIKHFTAIEHLIFESK